MDKDNIKKEYTTDDLTVVWQPGKCIHSAICANGLPGVFKPTEKPWVKMDQATTEEIKSQIDKCPSGALSYYTAEASTDDASVSGTRVEIKHGGPMLVHGDIQLIEKNGDRILNQKSTAFCRCGVSKNKPFCDGSHKQISFED